jgi:hypothetical protein
MRDIKSRIKEFKRWESDALRKFTSRLVIPLILLSVLTIYQLFKTRDLDAFLALFFAMGLLYGMIVADEILKRERKNWTK